MKVLTLVVVLSGLTGIGGCSSTQPETGHLAHPVYMSAFPKARTLEIETPEEILTLPAAALEYVRNTTATAKAQNAPVIDRLIDGLFAEDYLNLSYYSEANSVVAETFTNRQANCLSLTLLAYALAREAGLQVMIQDVRIPEYWSRNQGFSVLNGHVNLIVKERVEQEYKLRLVDFGRMMQSQQFPADPMPIEKAIALFYNNKAANALVSGQFDLAFRYVSAALAQDNTLTEAWINLGVLYRFNNHYRYAEEAYNKAVALNPDKLTAKENLVILYRLTDRHAEAQSLENEVKRRRAENPYYQLIQGDEAFEAGNIVLARTFYRQAYRLDRNNHLILFALGKSAYASGDVDNAQNYLERALLKAELNVDKERYAAKLSMLTH